MKLKEYFDRYHTPKAIFARMIGVTPATIYAILQGHNIFLDLALKIQDATHGEVTCEDLRPTAKKRKRKSLKQKMPEPQQQRNGT